MSTFSFRALSRSLSSRSLTSRHLACAAAILAIGVCGASSATAQTVPGQDHDPGAAAAKPAAPAVTQAPHGAHAASVLGGLSQDLQTLSHAVEPSVVKIYATGLAPVEGGEGSRTAFLAQQRMLGSGVIMDPRGYILTNAHVVEHARSLNVLVAERNGTLQNDNGDRAEPPATAITAHIVGMDSVTDLAVIKVDKADLPALKFGDSDRTHPGELVLAFGSPLGLQDSVSLGVISAVNRQLDPDSPMVYLQTDAAINPGNSGGPLIDMQGDVVGINSMIVSQSGGNEGVGFSIPSDTAKIVYEQLMKYGHSRRGAVGIYPTNITPTLAQGLGLPRNNGVLVEDLAAGSPAAAAGLKITDILTSLDGQSMRDTRQLALMMFRKRPGETARMGVLSGGVAREVDVKVTESPRDAASLIDPAKTDQYVVPRLGVLAVPIDEAMAKTLGGERLPGGLLVVARTFGTSADEVQLKVGDIVHSVNGTPTDSLMTLKDFMKGLKSGDPVVLQVERNNLLEFLPFRFEE